MQSSALTLSALIEHQAALVPDAVAVSYHEKKLTFRQLNNQANHFARFLLAQNIKPYQIAAICIDRSIELIVTLLALQKLGIAYLPVSPDIPKLRLDFILQDADACCLLAQQHLSSDWKAIDTPLIYLESFEWEDHGSDAENLNIPIAPLNPAYVLYTSGSTGEPKGVINHQSAIINRLLWMRDHYQVSSSDRILQKTPYTFDVSVWEFFLPLIAGATLVMAEPEGHKDISYLAQLIEREKITLLHYVPSMLNVFLEQASIKDFNSVRQVVCSGEELSAALLEKFNRSFHADCKLANLYGPTEAAIDVSYYDCPRVHVSSTIPIGKAIENIQLYILDSYLNPLSDGQTGELCIGGIGLATVYVNRAGQTAEKFFPDPFTKLPGARLYATGDLARWNSEGDIEFLGRIDHQVKINGQRIELGEIEVQLMRHEQVSAAVVVPYSLDGSSQHLLAYVVPKWSGYSKEMQSNLVNWTNIYDDTYQDLDNHADNMFNNFLSWQSSYDNQPIPELEMQHFFDATAARIKSLRSKCVLEIGCGSGLVLFRLLPFVEHYDATDISETALEYVSKQLPPEVQAAQKVTLYCQAADTFSNLKHRDYDLVILNSVIQYFPALEYLDEIICASLERISSGQIFIGDVRNYDLHECFQASVVHARYANLDRAEKRELLKWRIDNEIELLVSPLYFFSLQTQHSKISHVEILPKSDVYNNEMTKYRYDVILHINKNSRPVNPIPCVSFIKDKPLLSQISSYESIPVCITGIPNGLLAQDFLNLTDMQPVSVASSDNTYKQTEILALAEQHGLSAKIVLTPYEYNGSYSVILGKEIDVCIYGTSEISNAHCAGRFANEPWRGQLAKAFPSVLKTYLTDSLPGYMIPHQISLLKSMPLNSSGKIDRKNLPKPNAHLAQQGLSSLKIPIDKIEADLLSVWQDIFNTISIGTDANFFALGGDSIISMRIGLRLQEKGYSITSREVFQHPIIAQLASYLRDNSKKIAASNPIESMRSPKSINEQIDALNLSEHDKTRLRNYISGKLIVPEAICETPMFISALLYESLAGKNPETNLEMVNCELSNIKIDLLLKAWLNLIKQHEILRTEFCFLFKDTVLQLIFSDADLRYETYDWSSYSQTEFDNKFIELKNKLWSAGMDLASNSLMKLHFIKQPNQSYTMLWVLHHALTDGWTYQVFLQDIFTHYNNLLAEEEGNTHTASHRQLQYRDFCNWIYTLEQDPAKRFWLDYIGAPRSSTQLSQEVGSSLLMQKRAIQRINLELNSESTQKLLKLSGQESVTLNTIMQLIWAILLSERTNSSDIYFGMVISLRQLNLTGIERIAGPLFNVVPVYFNLEDNMQVLDGIHQCMQLQLTQVEHAHLDYREIFKLTSLPGGKRLYDSLYVFENYPSEFPDIVSNIQFDSKTNNPIVIMIWPGKSINIECYYDSLLFEYSDILCLLNDYKTLISSFLANPMQNIKSLKRDIFSKSEPTETLDEWVEVSI